MKRKWLRCILTGMGVCFCIAAGTLAIFNAQEAEQAEKSAEATLKRMQPMISHSNIQPDKDLANAEVEVEQNGEMPEKMIDGVFYIGVLNLPKLGLELPVISKWSNEHAKTAPCRYSGSVYLDDLILCAHNYKSHFGKLHTLEEGEALSFTDVEGNEYFYEIGAFEILEGTAIAEMESGDWDLTLFTCTAGGKARFTVRCCKVNK